MINDFGQTAAGAREVRISLQRGDISIRVGEEWRLEFYSQSNDVPEVERHGDSLRIKQRSGPFMLQKMDVSLIMPAEVHDVELKTGMGKVDVTGVKGEIEVSTGNGPVTIVSAEGKVEMNTGNGEVSIENFEGQMKANSGNGVTRIQDASGEIRLNTGNGRVEVRSVDGNVRVATGNGDIHLNGVSGSAEASTGHGGVSVHNSRSLDIRANTGMGNIGVEGGSIRYARINSMVGEVRCNAQLEPGKFEMSTGMGGVTVHLAPNSRARVDAQTGFGQVRSDFPLVRVGRSGPMGFGGVRMVGSISEANADVDLSLRSGKGTISILRNESLRRTQTDTSQSDSRRWGMLMPNRSASEEQPRAEQEQDPTMRILEAVARGEISPEEADRLLKQA